MKDDACKYPDGWKWPTGGGGNKGSGDKYPSEPLKWPTDDEKYPSLPGGKG